MAQSVTNFEERRPPEQKPAPSLPPPEVAVARPHPRRNDWALHAVGIGAILAICYYGEKVLVVLLISALLAFVLAPLSDLLTRARMPHWLAAMLSLAALLGSLAVAAYYSVNEVSSLIEELPRYSAQIRTKVDKLSRKTQKIEEIAQAPEKDAVKVHEATNWTEVLSRGFGSWSDTVLAASFIPFLIFFMLTWHEHVRAATVGLFPLQNRHAAYSTMGMIAGMVRSFILGNALIALLIGGISTAVFGLLGIPFFYFAGLASGFLSLIPYLGVVLALLPPFFVGVGHLSISAMIWVAATVFVLHVVSFNVLYPKMLGSRVRLNPLTVTVALLVWGWVWGAAGLALAVPVTAGMKIIFDHVESLKPYGAWLGVTELGNGARDRG